MSQTRFSHAARLSLRAAHGCACALALLPLMSGCGSGGGTAGGGVGGGISRCGLDSFTPNYARELDHLLTWSRFPIRIYFIRDANYSAAREAIARAGFDQWVDATDGALDYAVVNTASAADIKVDFDPSTANGLTVIRFRGFDITSADITLGVKNQLPADLQCISAHELGHALGIDGHSDMEGDLMYPIHFIGTLCPITTRDLNTIKTGYCGVFGRSAPGPRPVNMDLPEQEIRIR
jgi:hypothetical protein